MGSSKKKKDNSHDRRMATVFEIVLLLSFLAVAVASAEMTDRLMMHHLSKTTVNTLLFLSFLMRRSYGAFTSWPWMLLSYWFLLYLASTSLSRPVLGAVSK